MLMLGGCQYVNVQSSQLSAILKTFSSDSKASPEPLWAVEYGGYSAAVQPLAIESSTLFINDNDAISFDGWRITKVSGLSAFNPEWEILDSGSERSFTVQGQVVATHQCNAWLKKNTEFGVRFEQHCVGKKIYQNIILVDDLGHITNIEQVVDTSHMPLRLRLNN